MKIKFKPLNLLFNLAVCLFILTVCFGVSPVVSVGVAVASGVVLGFVPHIKFIALQTGIQMDIWEADIEEAIFKDNEFINKSKDVSGDVLGGAVVFHPQSGGPGNVKKNRMSLPAEVRKRSDTVISYPLDEYTSDPLFIPNADTVTLSYNKRDSAIKEDKLQLNQEVAENMLYNWVGDVPARRILRSEGNYQKPDGTTVSGTVKATAPGATGTRKAFKLTDFQTARTFLANENRFFNVNMNALVPSNIISQLFPAGDIVTTTAMNQVSATEREKGIRYKEQGFDIMERSSVIIVDAAGNIKAPGALPAATDSEAILYWWGMAVERALGEVKFFEKLGDPQFYGDIYSFLVRMGGNACRTNCEGILVMAAGLTS